MSLVAARRHTTRERASQTEQRHGRATALQVGGIVLVAGGCEAPYDTRESVSDGVRGGHSACQWWLRGAIRHARKHLRGGEGTADGRHSACWCCSQQIENYSLS
jgi:hypothetical protein